MIIKRDIPHIINTEKFILVNEEDWLGFGLYNENTISCELSVSHYDKYTYSIIFTYGGKHFYKKMELVDSFNESYKIYKSWLKEYNLIKNYIEPEWFNKHGFE